MTGQTLSHYEVLDKLGAGGMGVVYKARDVNLGRMVALKFVVAHLADSSVARERFLREARAISALNHPNIATLYEVGETSGDLFLAFEFLPGGTLRSRLSDVSTAGRRMPVGDVITIAGELAAGLAHAHRNGILHRDIKPGNLMFDGEGRLKILDFGLSKLVDSVDITKPEALMGTPLYMSPEQAAGKPVDQRSDIFSFGIVLYEMLTGRQPFYSESQPGTLRLIAESDPPPIELLRPDVPESLKSIVNRALRKDPDGRYGRMEDVLTDLRGAPAGFEAATATVMLARRPFLTRRRNWIVLAALGLLAGLLILLIPRRIDTSPKQIAVLPFENAGKDPANQAFCDGVVETLTSTMTQMEQFQKTLLVVPAAEVRRQAVTSPSDARKAFGAKLVISGSVQRAGDHIRLIANLSDTKSPPRQLGSKLIERNVSELGKLQDEMAGNIAELLQVELKPEARKLLAAGGTAVGSAYDSYVTARGFLERWDKPGNLDKGLALMQKATDLDPNFALAYAGLGWGKWRRFAYTKDPKWLEAAQELASHAISIDRRVALGHITLGLVYKETGRYVEAIRSYNAALEIDSISVEAYRGIAEVYERMAKLDEAERTYRRAIELRPNDWVTQTMLGVFYSSHGNDAKAEAVFQKVVELTPDNAIAYRNLGAAHLRRGQYDVAERNYLKAIALKPDYYAAYRGLAVVYFNQGIYRKAADANERAINLSSGNSDYVLYGNLGDCYRAVPDLASKASQAYRTAIQIANQVLATNPSNARALASRGLYYAQLGEFSRALGDVDNARKAAPTEVNVLYQWAVVEELSHHRDQALTGFREAFAAGYPVADALHDPDLSQLRRDSRFQTITNKEPK